MRSVLSTNPDIVIIGSGVGGATVAAGLAGSGASVLILERGERLQDCPQARDARAIFIDHYFRTTEQWRNAHGRLFRPSHYYCVGGNSKFYGTILMRYRREDFAEKQHFEGVSPTWPFAYEELEPWYSEAEQLYSVRGALGDDPTEPFHSRPYPHSPVPDEPSIARFREELLAEGLHPASLPLGIDIDAWLARGMDPWDAFPDTTGSKMDAENCALRVALEDNNIALKTRAQVVRLDTTADGRRVESVHYRQDGEDKAVSPRIVVLCAGAINSAVILLRSGGVANSSDQVGRNYMSHNGAMLLVIDPRRRNDAVYQKTIYFNDFYFGNDSSNTPLGNVQMVGKVSGDMLRSGIRFLPKSLLNNVAERSIDCFVMSEDLPHPESRVLLDGDRVVLQWRRTNLEALRRLTARVRKRLRACDYPIVLSKRYTEENPGHQCGTVRMGDDPRTAPLDPFCRSYDQPNLFVVDGSCLPNSAAVNPALTIAALALRAANHIRQVELAA